MIGQLGEKVGDGEGDTGNRDKASSGIDQEEAGEGSGVGVPATDI